MPIYDRRRGPVQARHVAKPRNLIEQEQDAAFTLPSARKRVEQRADDDAAESRRRLQVFSGFARRRSLAAGNFVG